MVVFSYTSSLCLDFMMLTTYNIKIVVFKPMGLERKNQHIFSQNYLTNFGFMQFYMLPIS